MPPFRQGRQRFSGGAVGIGRRDTWVPPYNRFCRARVSCRGGAVRCRRADRGVRPYGSETRGAMGGRPQGSPLRGRCKGCVGESGIPQSRLRRASPFRQGGLGDGGHGCSCCGAQNFHAALRRTLEILTAATRSLRFLCHRQRSVRSPHRPAPVPLKTHSLPCLKGGGPTEGWWRDL